MTLTVLTFEFNIFEIWNGEGS